MTLVYGALVVFIVTTIVTQSYLFSPLRELAYRVRQPLGVLLSCFLCFGTWVGWAVAAFISDRWIIDGLAFHGLAYLTHTAVNLVGDLRTWLQRT